MSNTTGAVVAAMRMKAEREMIEALETAQAFSPDKAIPLMPNRNLGKLALRGLLRQNAVRQARAGFYYLDEPVYAAVRKSRQRLAIGVAVIAVVFLGAIVIATSSKAQTVPVPAAAAAATQIYDQDWPAAARDGEPAFLYIKVQPDHWGDAPPPGWTLTFHAPTSRRPHSPQEALEKPVTVFLTSGGSDPDMLARSETCPAIHQALTELGGIPSAALIPKEINPIVGDHSRIPPRVLHGATYEISFRPIVANGNAAAVSLVDQSGDYAHWAGRAQTALSSCWTTQTQAGRD